MGGGSYDRPPPEVRVRLFLAIQAFFTILFAGRVPAKALPPPEEPADKKAERERLGRELEEARKKLGEVERARDDAQQRLGETSTEREQLLAARKTAEAERDTARSEREQAAKERDQAQERLGELKARLAEVEQKVAAAREDGALALLGWLQREGRLIDFLREKVEAYEDAQVGAAARAIHAGCKKVLEEGFAPQPILGGEEGGAVTVEVGFDPVAIQLSGQVKGNPPYKGTLVHHGWRGTRAAVPVPERVDTRILAPAEVEL